MRRIRSIGLMFLCTLLASLLAGFSNLVPEQPNREQPFSFKASYLVSLSDADMVATAYDDGLLGERKPGVVDALTVIPMPSNFRSRGLGNQENPVGRVNVSNSINGVANCLTISNDGKTAFVIELKGPAPLEATQFDEQPLGAKLQVVSLDNPMQPTITQEITVGTQPEAIDLNSQGNLLAVITNEAGKRIQLIPVEQGRVGQPQSFPLIGVENIEERATNVDWHPSGQFLAVNLPLSGQVMFYKVSQVNEQYDLVPWGNSVNAGKFPGSGYFTPDGRFFISTALQWGEGVERFYIDPPPGELFSIRFSTEGTVHPVVSTATVGSSPESFRISPDGSLVVTANMRNSGLVWDDPRMTTESSLSLVTLNRNTGQLNTVDEYFFEGILPQGLAWDADSRAIAITVQDYFDLTARRGGIEFWQVERSPTPSLIRTGFSATVAKGPYQVEIIP